MYTSYHHVVKEVFSKAVTLDHDERVEYLDRSCGQNTELRIYVERLLQADSNDHDTFISSVETVLNELDDEYALSSGTQIKDMHIQECLSSSQMSRVYLAIRKTEEFEQKVIIKILRNIDSDETKRWFAQEKRLQAQLNHPYIAQLIDSGVTQSETPYIVIEYINGLSINDYCDKYKLSLKQRLQLCIKVCEAVQFAHARLVIHSDIKPSNILITEDGLPKLVDFGIARIADKKREPAALSLAFTPRYASPELIRGRDITISTDIFSITALMAEILSPTITDQRDVLNQTKIYSKIDILASESVSQLHTLIKCSKLDKELQFILLKGASNDPKERYVTVNSLKEDIQNYLSGKPIKALSHSGAYIFKKFALNNIWPIALTVVALASLGIFNTYLSRESSRALAAEADAMQQLRISNTITDYLIGSYKEAGLRPNDFSVRQLLDLTSSNLIATGGLDDVTKAYMYNVLGNAYQNVGDQETAIDYLAQSQQLAENPNRPVRPDLLIDIYDSLFKFYHFINDAENRLLYYEKMKQVSEQQTPLPQNAYKVYMAESRIAYSKSDHAQMKTALEKARAMMSDAVTEADRLDIYHGDAVLAYIEGDFEKSLSNYQRILEYNRKTFGENSMSYASSIRDAIPPMILLDQLDEAEQLVLHAIKIEETQKKPFSRSYRFLLNRLAGIYVSSGKNEQAEEILLELIEKGKSAGDMTLRDHFFYLNNLAFSYESREMLEPALDNYLKSLAVADQIEPKPAFYNALIVNISRMYRMNEDYSGSIQLINRIFNDIESSNFNQWEVRRLNIELVFSYTHISQADKIIDIQQALAQYYADNQDIDSIEQSIFHFASSVMHDALRNSEQALYHANLDYQFNMERYGEDSEHTQLAKDRMVELEEKLLLAEAG